MSKPRFPLLSVVLIVLGVALVSCGRDTGPAQDEAKLAGKTPADFPEAAEDYFRDMDGGIALTEEEVKGRNTWMIWTGGNEAFWDWLANNSFGTFDLLKTLSSYPCSAEQETYTKKAKSSYRCVHSCDALPPDATSKPVYESQGASEASRTHAPRNHLLP